MATYQELTQLRPSIIAGLTRNHNIHLDPDPVIITTREAIRILAGGAVLAANLTVNCQSFAADDITTPVPVTTPALVPLSPFAGETIIEGDFSGTAIKRFIIYNEVAFVIRYIWYRYLYYRIGYFSGFCKWS